MTDQEDRINALAGKVFEDILDWLRPPSGMDSKCPTELISDAICSVLKEAKVTLRCNYCGEELQLTTHCHVVHCVKCREEAIRKALTEGMQISAEENEMYDKALKDIKYVMQIRVVRETARCQKLRESDAADFEAQLAEAHAEIEQFKTLLLDSGGS